MGAQCEVTSKQAAAGAGLGVVERWLTLWVALCIVVGITLGHFLADVFQSIGSSEVAQVASRCECSHIFEAIPRPRV
jgi:ACR3 family arsenite transporter